MVLVALHKAKKNGLPMAGPQFYSHRSD